MISAIPVSATTCNLEHGRASGARAGTVIDVSTVVDQAAITPFQIGTIVLCALVALLDGFDSQSIAVTAPTIAQGLGLARSSLGPIFSAGLLGAMVGALTFGPLADRFGRKSLLLIATVLFGAFTLLTAFVHSYEALLAARLAAGIGLGGATPCFLALASEYAPRRRRARLTSLLWSAFPFGAAAGAFINGYLLVHFDWHAVFIVGGVAPFFVAAALLAWLPESMRFMAAHRHHSARLLMTLRKIRPVLPPDARFVATEHAVSSAPLKQLFIDGRALGTLLLWVPFFTGFAVLAITVVWSPLLLRDHGFGLGEASIAIGFNSIGSLMGMAAAGWLMEKLGATRVIVPALVLGGVATAALGHAATSLTGMSIAMAVAGVFVGVGSSGSIALAALRYPTAIRSSGIGCAMGMGRFGQVLAPLVAAAMASRGTTGLTSFHVFGLAPVIGALAVLALGRTSSNPTSDAPIGPDLA